MKKTRLVALNSRGNVFPFLGAGIVILILIIIFSGTVFKDKVGNDDSSTPGDTKPSSELSSPHMVVYGEWTDNGTVIKSYDLANDKQYKVADLPLDIKKISILSSDKILFINKTNSFDHGLELAIYSISDKTITPLVSADPGFGIDDYMLSPNKKYISLWEVQFTQTQVLQGGKSKVTSLDLDNPTKKNLIESQDAFFGEPIFYPKAVANSGRIFMDQFVPNSGAGWAYGMRVSNFTGTQKDDLENMQSGTYGTQPNISPDGKYLVFAGYDGSKGSGTQDLNGFRRALVHPNTIELLDTDTLERKKIDVLSGDRIYTSVNWEAQLQDTIVYSLLSREDVGEEETYNYDLKNQSFQKISLNKPSAPQKLVQAFKEKVLGESTSVDEKLIGALGDNLLLSGTANNLATAMGNLGQAYASPFEKLALSDALTGIEKALGEDNALKQLISVERNDLLSTDKLTFIGNIPNEDSLQLTTFIPPVEKPDLAQTRERQQSGGFCRDLAHEQCEASLPAGTVTEITEAEYQAEGAKDSSSVAVKPKDGQASYYRIDPAHKAEYQVCYKHGFIEMKKIKGECMDSPLYVYGEAGQTVNIKPLTPISNSTAPYSEEGFNITTLSEGAFSVNGQTASSVDYDYQRAKKRITAPKNGLVVPTKNINQAIGDLASNLGLNQKETGDLIDYAKGRFTTPYVFASFYDHNTSQQILPLLITPKPQNYLNVVFYLKPLMEKPAISPNPPVYPETFSRDGLTVVEISEFVDE